MTICIYVRFMLSILNGNCWWPTTNLLNRSETSRTTINITRKGQPPVPPLCNHKHIYIWYADTFNHMLVKRKTEVCAWSIPCKRFYIVFRSIYSLCVLPTCTKKRLARRMYAYRIVHGIFYRVSDAFSPVSIGYATLGGEHFTIESSRNCFIVSRGGQRKAS